MSLQELKNSSAPGPLRDNEGYTFYELNELALRHRVLPIQPQLDIIPMPIGSKVVPLVIDVRERCASTHVTRPARGSGSGRYRGFVNLCGIISICGGL